MPIVYQTLCYIGGKTNIDYKINAIEEVCVTCLGCIVEHVDNCPGQDDSLRLKNLHCMLDTNRSVL